MIVFTKMKMVVFMVLKCIELASLWFIPFWLGHLPLVWADLDPQSNIAFWGAGWFVILLIIFGLAVGFTIVASCWGIIKLNRYWTEEIVYWIRNKLR